MKHNIIEIKPITETIKPIIQVIDKKNFYDIYIFLQGLTKEEIILKYINNFLMTFLKQIFCHFIDC